MEAQQTLPCIIDPDYARIFTVIRKIAKDHGYALAAHGSFTSDLDLIAIPWTDGASNPEKLLNHILASNLKLKKEEDYPTMKPHGRQNWILLFPDFGDPRYVDLSIMPREE